MPPPALCVPSSDSSDTALSGGGLAETSAPQGKWCTACERGWPPWRTATSVRSHSSVGVSAASTRVSLPAAHRTAVRQVITLSSPIRQVRHEQSRANRLFQLHAHQHIEPSESAGRTRRRVACGPGNVDLHPARRDRRLADLPGRAVAAHREHRGSRQPPRHRQSSCGALGDGGSPRPTRRPMETVSTAAAIADGLPITRKLIMTNLANILTESARRHPERPAIRLDDDVVTYAELDDLTARAAGWLRACGVEPGDRVAIALPNVVQFPVMYYGALRVGATVVPMNPLLKSREIEHHLSDSGAKLALVWTTVAAEADVRGQSDGHRDRGHRRRHHRRRCRLAVSRRRSLHATTTTPRSSSTPRGRLALRKAHSSPTPICIATPSPSPSCSTCARTTSCWVVFRCFTHSGRATD